MRRKRVIAVTGTPGTGKSTFSRVLSKDLGYEMLDLNELIEEKDIYELAPDDTRVVDPGDLRNAFDEVVAGKESGLVVDGHLSHLLDPDIVTEVLVLRTDPDILEERLGERDYSEEKLQDNLEAEILDIVLEEAIRKHGEENVYEIDISQMGVSEAVDIFEEALDGERRLEPGSVDWLEEHVEKIQNVENEKSG